APVTEVGMGVSRLCRIALRQGEEGSDDRSRVPQQDYEPRVRIRPGQGCEELDGPHFLDTDPLAALTIPPGGDEGQGVIEDVLVSRAGEAVVVRREVRTVVLSPGAGDAKEVLALLRIEGDIEVPSLDTVEDVQVLVGKVVILERPGR